MSVVPGIVAGNPDEDGNGDEQEQNGERRRGRAVVAAGKPERAGDTRIDHGGEGSVAGDRQAEEQGGGCGPRKVQSPQQPQAVGAKPAETEQQAGQDRDHNAAAVGGSVRSLRDRSVDGHQCDQDQCCAHRSGRLNQPLEAVAVDRQGLGQGCGSQREQTEAEQKPGARRSPELDVQTARQHHGQDGGDGESPADGRAGRPFRTGGGAARKAERESQRRATVLDGAQ